MLVSTRIAGSWLLVASFCTLSWVWMAVFNVKACSGEEAATEELAFMELEDVFAAAKHSQEIKDAPASVTIVTDEDIRRYGYRNISDILRNVTGFVITDDRMYEYTGFRGISRFGEHGNLLLQLIDGHTYNEGIYGSFFLGNTFGLDIDMIKKVEVVRGPASALFGSSAFLGVVNVVPKSGEDIHGLYTKAEVGSYGTAGGGAIYGNKFENGLDLICGATYLDSVGKDFFFPQFAHHSPTRGWARDADAERALSGFLRAAYHEFIFTGLTRLREKNVPTGVYETIFGDDRLQVTDQRSFVEGKWNHSMENDSQIMARAYYDNFYYNGEYPYDYPPVTMNEDVATGHWIGSEVKYMQKVFGSHSLTLGGEATHYLTSELENFDVEPRRVLLEDRRSFSAYSAYLQDEWEIVPWLRLVGGARYDDHTLFGDHVSPRAGVIARPLEESTLKLLYGQAFRAPTVFELFYDDKGFTARANPDLDAEILSSYEIVWEQEFSTAWKGVASLFRYEVEKMIMPVDLGGGIIEYRNIADVTSQGVEAGVEGNVLGGLRGGLSYSYQYAVDERTEAWLPNSPKHLVKARISYPVYKDKLYAAVLCRYMSDRLTRSRQQAEGAFVTDISLYARNLLKGLELNLGIYNLFDVDYADPASPDNVPQTIGQSGINVWLKVGYSF